MAEAILALDETPNPYKSAENLAAYYGQRAGDALAHAMEHDKLAGKQPASDRAIQLRLASRASPSCTSFCTKPGPMKGNVFWPG